MSNPEDTEQSVEQKESSQELANPDNGKIDKIASELEAKVIENPEVLGRILDNPVIMAIAHESFRGPVPSPKMLSEYEQIMPGLANRLVKLTEDEQSNRHSWMDKTLTLASGKDKRGQWMAYSLSLIILLMAFFFAYRGNTVFAGTLVAIDLIGLASVFALGRVSQSQDKE